MTSKYGTRFLDVSLGELKFKKGDKMSGKKVSDQAAKVSTEAAKVSTEAAKVSANAKLASDAIDKAFAAKPAK